MYDEIKTVTAELEKRGVAVSVESDGQWWMITFNGVNAVFGSQSISEVRAFLSGLLAATARSATIQ